MPIWRSALALALVLVLVLVLETSFADSAILRPWTPRRLPFIDQLSRSLRRIVAKLTQAVMKNVGFAQSAAQCQTRGIVRTSITSTSTSTAALSTSFRPKKRHNHGNSIVDFRRPLLPVDRAWPIKQLEGLRADALPEEVIRSSC